MSSSALHRALLAAGAGALLALAPAAVAAPLPVSGTLDLATDADKRVLGERFGDEAGGAVSPAGDVNGDGQLDLLVPARRADPRGRTDAGSAFVLFGPVRDLPPRLADLGSRGLRIDGARAGDLASTSVSQAGDVDGDGLGDVLVGAPGAQIAYLVRGRREGGAIDLAAGAPGVTRLGTNGPTDRTGASVGRVPDLDGDGRAELVIGAPGVGTAREGAAFVVFARTVGGDDVDLGALGDRGLRLDGAARAEAASRSTAPGHERRRARRDPRRRTAARARRSRRSGDEPAHPGAGYVVFGRAEPGRIDLAALGGRGSRSRPGPTTRRSARPSPRSATRPATACPTWPSAPRTATATPGRERQRARHRRHGDGRHRGGRRGDRPGFRVDGAAAGDALG
jgi:hypothetical protein